MRLDLTLRVARPSRDLAQTEHFYCEGLGFEVLYRFADHEGFDGLMASRREAPYHLEFTHAHTDMPVQQPSPEDLLIFYIPDRAEWQAATARMRTAGYSPVKSANPYWDRGGLTFADPDDFRVVLFHAAWQL